MSQTEDGSVTSGISYRQRNQKLETCPFLFTVDHRSDHFCGLILSQYAISPAFFTTIPDGDFGDSTSCCNCIAWQQLAAPRNPVMNGCKEVVVDILRLKEMASIKLSFSDSILFCTFASNSALLSIFVLP